jgi:hypothetical protein
MDCSEARVSLGVYVLGAIDPAERAMVDSHLAGCRDCRDELAGLAGLPALLARVSMEEAVALAATGGPPVMEEQGYPPQELAASVADLTAARRRRRTWREAGLAVAAAFIIAAGVLGGLRLTAAPQVSNAGAVQPPWLQTGTGGQWEDAAGQSGAMTALIMYRPVHWGTEFTATVSGIPSGTTCQIWVVGPGKTRLLAGSWIVDGNEGSVWYPGSAAISAPKVEKFVITVGKDQAITADA